MAASQSRGEVLFELPIGEKGNVVCTRPKDEVYLIIWTSPPDNRLRTDFCQTVLLALDILETRYPVGAVILTSGIEKFFSNGLDLEHAFSTPNYFPDSLYALWRRLLTYPMPVIALINGHGFAGGLMTAMMCDYRVMNPQKGFLCLNELEMGAHLMGPMSTIFRQKTSPQVYRKLVLEATRFKAADALQAGIIDGVGGLSETLSFIDELKLTQKSQPGLIGKSAYSELKRGMWRETLQDLGSYEEEEARHAAANAKAKEDLEVSEKKVKQWEAIKTKL